MQLAKNEMFHTPEEIEYVWDWIERHNGAEKIHLYTAVMMFNNWIADNYELVEKEGK